MNRIVVKSRVGSNGILQVDVPVGVAEANRDVRITVEPIESIDIATDEWRRAIQETAGKWQGDFQRPVQGEYERREDLP